MLFSTRGQGLLMLNLVVTFIFIECVAKSLAWNLTDSLVHTVFGVRLGTFDIINFKSIFLG